MVLHSFRWSAVRACCALLAALSLHASLALAGPTTLTVGNATGGSGNTDHTMNFTVTRGGDLQYDVTFTYHSVDATAAYGVDYDFFPGTVHMLAGATSASIPIDIHPNSGHAPPVTFQLVLDAPIGLGAATPLAAPSQLSAQACLPFAVSDLFGNGAPEIAAYCNGGSVRAFGNLSSIWSNTIALDGNGPTFSYAPNTRQVAQADLNGDGKPDLILVNYLGNNNVDVALNTTAPNDASGSHFSFGAAQTIAASNVVDLRVADINGDGKPDLLVTDFFTIGVLINTTVPGASSVSFATLQPFTPAQLVHAIAVADINSDGRPDIVAAGTSPAVLLNVTVPGSSLAAFAESDPNGSGSNIAVADYNNDGRPDLITTDCQVLLNTTPAGAAAATFASPRSVCAQANQDQIAIADYNLDGRPDFVLGSLSFNNLALLINTTPAGSSTPSAAPVQIFPVSTSMALNNPIPYQLAAADLNGDGRPDVVVSTFDNGGSAGEISFMANANQFATASPPAVALSAPQDFATGSNPFSVATADINADGLADLIVANSGSHSISVLLNTTPPGAAQASYSPKQDFAAGDGDFVTAADLNNDGLADLIVTDSTNNRIAVLLNTTPRGASSATFAPAQTFNTGALPTFVAAGDLNGDGLLDLAVSSGLDNKVSVLFNTTAPGAASASFAAPVSFATGALPVSVAIADVNRDYLPDLIVADNGSDNVAVLLNNTAPGAATPAFAAAQTFGAGSAPTAMIVKDLNGDGLPDIGVVDRGDSSVTVLRNTTAIGTNSVTFASANYAVGAKPQAIAAADVNGDGVPDLLVANSASNSLSVLVNARVQATLAFNAATSIAVGASPISLAVADSNSDGKADIIVVENSQDSVAVLLDTEYQVSVAGPATGTIVHDLIFENGFE